VCLGALAALLVGAGAGPSVVVSRLGDHLDVEAKNAAVAEVLDAVAAAIGIEIEYEGAPPRQPLTLTLRGRTAAEAVLSVLDGQPVDYALQLDASGHGVARLLIQAAGSAPRQSRPAPPVRRAPTSAPTPPPLPEFVQPFDPGTETDEEPVEDEPADQGEPAAGPALPPGIPRFPTNRPGRPAPAPLLFPGPLNPVAPTPTPPPQS
jgi:hypothetical protein